VQVGRRPNGVAVAGGMVWVTSSFDSAVQRVDAASLRALAPVKVGPDAASIAPDGDGVWIALKSPHQVVRVDAAGKITTRLRTPGAPTRLAVGVGSLWVAVERTGEADLVIRYGLDGREPRPTPIAHDIVGLAVGQGYVWIAEKNEPGVLRLDPSTGETEPWTTLADAISDLYDGGGALWATLAAAGSIARIDPAKRNSRITTAIGHRPLRTVAAGGRVYVTLNVDHDVARIDPATAQRAASPFGVPPNPFAITADSHALWVTGTGKNTLTRVPLG
jgi:streptogramin lyase